MIIKVNNATKQIRNTQILKNINLEFESGNVYGITGENGCGKTMLLRLICGLIYATDGYVQYDDQILKKTMNFVPNIGVIIEKPDFPPFLTGYEILKCLADIKKQIKEDEINQYLDLFEMDSYKNTPVRKYSLGMKQKIGIIQAFMENPDVLILDEPFNALDKKSVETLYTLIKKFKNQGKLIILTSHHQTDITSLCDKVIEMTNGTIIPNNTI